MLYAASSCFSFDSFFPIALPSKRLSFSPKPIAWRFPRSPDRRRREKRIPITQTLNKKKEKKGFLKKIFIYQLSDMSHPKSRTFGSFRLYYFFKKMSFE